MPLRGVHFILFKALYDNSKFIDSIENSQIFLYRDNFSDKPVDKYWTNIYFSNPNVPGDELGQMF